MSTKFLLIFIRFVVKLVNNKVDVRGAIASQKFKDFGEKSITLFVHSMMSWIL